MSGEREDILLQMNNVRYKKDNGQLYLSQTRVGWLMDESDTSTVSVPYNDIRTQKISPEGKPKVQLQLVLHDMSSYTFHFCTPEGRDKQVAERNQVKERLSQLMTQNRRQPPNDLMEKKRMLDENEQLHHLYRALVPTSIISVDEFWKEIAGQYMGEHSSPMADIKPQTDGNNGKVQYNLTPEIMSSVFKTYPAVKKKHIEYVPHRMTESEFWTLFFQSHYYSVHTTSRIENVFSECSKHDDREWNRDVSSTQNDPLHALNDIYDEKPMSTESDLRVAGVKAGSNVFHALMIKSATDIIKHIAINMKKKICRHIKQIIGKISVLIDDSTSLSIKTALIVYLKCESDKEGDPHFMFLDLIELPDQKAATIAKHLMNCLNNHGFDDSYLKQNLVAFASDGASIMLGVKSGVATILKEHYPDVIIWHCLNHRLELAVGDSVTEVHGVNHFQSFMDKLYSVYSRSPLTQRDFLNVPLN
ncbi:General transcription factor IIH subunit 1-like [Homarus americanus]|uniref:General transcription factor IIH subunit 1-like n=1 Tax=Homarus americanus TaxID=6706 RepID=A0A8J5N1F0_HOMAM|nr:General transcription factor IIH subunit 1-like [Homarus americanus]